MTGQHWWSAPVRQHLFTKRGMSMESLPPAKAALVQHVKRTVYHAGLMGQAFNATIWSGGICSTTYSAYTAAHCHRPEIVRTAMTKGLRRLLSRTAFYQRVSIASYANRWYSERRNVRVSVRPSVTLRYCIKMKKASVEISSPSERLNILVSRNIWFITKFERGHPERGRFMRLGLVKIGNFDDFSTNKPQYLRNGAR